MVHGRWKRDETKGTKIPRDEYVLPCNSLPSTVFILMFYHVCLTCMAQKLYVSLSELRFSVLLLGRQQN